MGNELKEERQAGGRTGGQHYICHCFHRFRALGLGRRNGRVSMWFAFCHDTPFRVPRAFIYLHWLPRCQVIGFAACRWMVGRCTFPGKGHVWCSFPTTKRAGTTIFVLCVRLPDLSHNFHPPFSRDTSESAQIFHIYDAAQANEAQSLRQERTVDGTPEPFNPQQGAQVSGLQH